MFDTFLAVPLLLTLTAAALAAAYGHPSLNRRLTITQASWLLALLPLAAFVFFLSRLPAIANGTALTFSVAWMPSLGMTANLYYDSLSALFLLLVTGIGTLVIIYSGYYFKGDNSAWRFLAYLFLFMTAMVGVLLAGDVITLFVFWELTSVSSFLLIAYKTKDEAARQGAFKSLFITGGGGIALLAGLLFVSSVAGNTDYATILTSGDILRASPLYGVMLGLVAFGAFTKSAQVPAHIWLPDAMTAPTPASAYLHSATMVKAGIYLLARMNPALGLTDTWFWLLTSFGLITMLVGAYQGLKQNDLKALLAYSTISQLGVLVMLIGDDTPQAFKALVISVVAHALYKSALFLIVGIVDHEAGTRDLRRLGGLRHAMPLTFAVGAVAALSMAGLPPMFGFLAKETLLASVTHPSVPVIISALLSAAVVAAGALILAQAGMLIWDTFLGRPRDPTIHAHEAPRWMIAMPAIPALLSLAFGLLPEPERLAGFLRQCRRGGLRRHGEGIAGVVDRHHPAADPEHCGGVAWDDAMGVPSPRACLAEPHAGTPKLQSCLHRHTRTARPRGLPGHSDAVGPTASLPGGHVDQPDRVDAACSAACRCRRRCRRSSLDELTILRVFTLVLATAAAGLSIFLRRDFDAILALGASGLSVAVIMVLEPAPDVALVQVVVDILSVVILTLALTSLPREQRRRSWELTFKQSRVGLVRDGLIAAAAGFAVHDPDPGLR